MQKLLSLVMFLILAGVTGCAPGNGSDKVVSDKITVWHWMTDREDTFNELAKKYKALTGTDVQF